ncbi:MAG: FecR family protein [Pseudoxanthomonas mexicana]|nr:FecR family protein [Pseudoxanthomonas mexicana]
MNDMDKHPDRIAEQAAEYFARRRGATSPQRRERDYWLSEDFKHAEAYDALQRVWDHAGSLADDPELQALKTADLAAVRRRRWFRPQRLLAVAATLVMLLGAGYIIIPFMQPPPPVGYATVLGERRTETMPDGSEIVLNTDSALEVSYSSSRRAIALLHGEAQFEVARDRDRPFVVSIGENTVTALGTRFQVRREPGSTIVTLLEGSVEVAHGDERHVLKPNERAILSERMGVSIALIDPESATGWLDGWLRFRGAPLAEVIVEANRYSDQKLRLGDPRLADVQLSGNFHAGDNTSIADAASLILPVRVEKRGSEIVLMPQ